MRVAVFLTIVSLSGCNAAGPHFRGLVPHTVTVDGSTFDVRVRGNLAEAIRTNPEYAPRLGPIQTRAARAITRVSGCTVVKTLGDQAQITAVLACEATSPHSKGIKHVVIGATLKHARTPYSVPMAARLTHHTSN